MCSVWRLYLGHGDTRFVKYYWSKDSSRPCRLFRWQWRFSRSWCCCVFRSCRWHRSIEPCARRIVASWRSLATLFYLVRGPMTTNYIISLRVGLNSESVNSLNPSNSHFGSLCTYLISSTYLIAMSSCLIPSTNQFLILLNFSIPGYQSWTVLQHHLSQGYPRNFHSILCGSHSKQVRIHTWISSRWEK